ncbi:MAG: hypothetical protein R3E31_16210 [Chloroflexota bacterium]
MRRNDDFTCVPYCTNVTGIASPAAAAAANCAIGNRDVGTAVSWQVAAALWLLDSTVRRHWSANH